MDTQAAVWRNDNLPGPRASAIRNGAALSTTSHLRWIALVSSASGHPVARRRSYGSEAVSAILRHMCGRYASTRSVSEIARLFRTVDLLPNIAPSWNVAPAQQALVVRRHPATGLRHLDLLSSGMLPVWVKEPS